MSAPLLRKYQVIKSPMNIAIVYGTNSSGTHEAATLVAHELRQAGHQVTMEHAKNIDPTKPIQADLLVLGSCTWERFEGDTRLEGELQQHMYALTQAWRTNPPAIKKFSLFALGDRSYTNFCHAADLLERFVAEIHGELVGPTLRIDSWFYNQPANRQVVTDWVKAVLAA